MAEAVTVAALTADGRCPVTAEDALLLVMEAVMGAGIRHLATVAADIRHRAATVVAGRRMAADRHTVDRRMAADHPMVVVGAAGMGGKFTPGCFPA